MATLAPRVRNAFSPWAVAPVAVLTGAFAASVVAATDMKVVLTAAGALLLLAVLAVVRQRELLVLGLLVAGLQFMLHKTFGPIDDTVQSGADALYVTSLDALLLLLYGLWWWDGTLVTDLRREMRRGVLWLPLLPMLLALPSLFNAVSVYDGAAELLRMTWMWLLFIYFAVRIRTRTQVTWSLAALFAIAAAQLAIVVLQWRTGGHLGLSFLGEDQSAQLRSTDVTQAFRPTGTSIHPDILAAVMGSIGLVGLALALNLTQLRLRLAFCVGATAAVAGMLLTQTRATIIGFALGGGLLILVAILTRRIGWRVIGAGALAAVVAVAVFWDRIHAAIIDNFFTDHFQLEYEARIQLAGIAGQMAEAHPLAGVGLNNFMQAMPTFDLYGLLYPGYPVHNLPLLVLAETGAIGVIGWIVVYAVLAVVAYRLARVQDRLLGGIGLAVLAMYVFYLAEEQLSFSLREDAPLALFWILAGLSLAALSMVRTPVSEPAVPE